MTKKKLTFFFRILFHVDYTHNQVVSYQLKMSCNSKSCIGCLHEQPNQLAHMDPGGCFYEESVWDTASEDSDSEEDFIQDVATEIRADQAAALEEGAQRLLEMDFGDDESEAWAEEESEEEVAEKEPEPEPERDPLFEAPIPLGECPICYEDLKMIDFTVTKCGHTFHSSCMFQALANNLDCPMCRCQLLAVQEDEEEEDQENEDDEEDEENEEDSQNGEEEEEDNRPTMEQLAVKLQNMGYTPVDFLTLFMDGILKRQDETRQSNEFLDDLNAKIDDIVDGKITMAHVDQRTYAQVAAKALEPQPQPQPQVAV
jgi:hypothetical protein